jgi:hypothetical protein
MSVTSLFNVSKHLSRAIAKQRKSISEIAVEIGYVNPEVMIAILNGKIQLPLDKVIPLAKSLEINSGELLYKALCEYAPETLTALRPFMRALELSQDELEVLTTYREYKHNTVTKHIP